MATVKELTIKESLQHLYNLQKIHTKIDEINILKGELPMEVSDLDDDVAVVSRGLDSGGLRVSQIEARGHVTEAAGPRGLEVLHRAHGRLHALDEVGAIDGAVDGRSRHERRGRDDGLGASRARRGRRALVQPTRPMASMSMAVALMTIFLVDGTLRPNY